MEESILVFGHVNALVKHEKDQKRIFTETGLVLTCVSSGLEDYLGRYREGMRRVLSSFGPVPEFDGEAATRINKVCAVLCFYFLHFIIFIDKFYE